MSFKARCGDVYGFMTRQAPNHRLKYKYHLYLCTNYETPRQHIFMFINSHGTKSCMRISPRDWAGMTKARSFIFCTRLFMYPASELKSTKLTHRDRLSDAALSRLLGHIETSETITETDRDIILDALTGYFAG